MVGLALFFGISSAFSLLRYANQKKEEKISVAVGGDSEELFAFREDAFDGVIIDKTSLPQEVNSFTSRLSKSLSAWKSLGKKGVWLILPVHLLHFQSILRNTFGFHLHHAEKTHAVFTTWLGDGPNTIPANASHQIGLGCVVLRPEENKILVVQEKNGPLRGKGIWKVPTGLVEVGEHLDAAARREVLEETGIETEFLGVAAFRHMHGVFFGKSDMFFLCVLSPKSTDIVPQELEIAACEWMDLESYLSQQYFRSKGWLVELNAEISVIAREMRDSIPLSLLVPMDHKGCSMYRSSTHRKI